VTIGSFIEPPNSEGVIVKCGHLFQEEGDIISLGFTLEKSNRNLFDIAPSFDKNLVVKSPQSALPGFLTKVEMTHGGNRVKGNPKNKRPFVKNKVLHVVFKSSKATGDFSFLKFDRVIRRILSRQAKTLGIKIYQSANAGNHIHLVLKAHSRLALSRFLRAVSGLIVRKVLGKERGRAELGVVDAHKKVHAQRGKQPSNTRIKMIPTQNKNTQSFFDARPYSRIVHWGRDYAALKNYLVKNSLDLVGFSRESSSKMLSAIQAFLKHKDLVVLGFS